MITKTYTAKYASYSTVIRMNDNTTKRIEFNDGYRIGIVTVSSRYTTSNPEIMKGLESTKQYLRDYTITEVVGEEEKADDCEEVEIAKEETINTITVFEEVKTVKDAMELFVNTFGLKPLQCNCKSKIEKKCKELNVEFPYIEYEL